MLTGTMDQDGALMMISHWQSGEYGEDKGGCGGGLRREKGGGRGGRV